MKKAATARNELAIRQSSNVKKTTQEKFGIRRSPTLYAAIRGAMLTPLKGSYQEYGVALKKVIEKAVEGKTASELENGINIEENEVSDEEYSIFADSSITIRRVSAETLLTEASGPEKYMENVSRECELGAFDAFIVSVTLVTRKWDKSDDTVKDISIPVSHYILPVPIEEMSTGLNMRWHGYPLLKKEGLPIIVHADPSSFKDLEPKIEAQFNLCLQEEENADLLKKKVAVLLYLMAQATFYQRGSAAIAEWVEQAIYQYHGFNVEYKHPDPSIEGKPSRDLDVFVSLTKKNYVDTYTQKAHLTLRKEDRDLYRAAKYGRFKRVLEILKEPASITQNGRDRAKNVASGPDQSKINMVLDFWQGI